MKRRIVTSPRSAMSLTSNAHWSSSGVLLGSICLGGCMCACVFVCVYVCMYVYIRTYIHVPICMYIHIPICMFVCAHACMYVSVCVCVRICIYTSTPRACIHTQNKQIPSEHKLPSACSPNPSHSPTLHACIHTKQTTNIQKKHVTVSMQP
jgi:hypothetical protein